VRGGPKTLIVVAVALLLSAGLVACGGDDDPSAGSTAAEAPQGGAGGQPDGEGGKETSSSDGSGGGGGSKGSGGESGDSSGSSGTFTPRQHDDSGGGSAQFKVKGGDNSVQEFGAEADTSELDAAATALHNFLDARAAEDWAAACSFMSKSTTESLEKLASQAKGTGGGSCAAVLKSITNTDAIDELRAEAEQADVGSLRVEGEQAFVIYTGLEGAVIAIPVANENGSWKVASLGGTPLL
jgi:hypothetical protein